MERKIFENQNELIFRLFPVWGDNMEGRKESKKRPDFKKQQMEKFGAKGWLEARTDILGADERKWDVSVNHEQP